MKNEYPQAEYVIARNGFVTTKKERLPTLAKVRSGEISEKEAIANCINKIQNLRKNYDNIRNSD